MVFGVAIKPWLKQGGTSPEALARTCGELAEMGIGAIKIPEGSPDDAEWVETMRRVVANANDAGLRISAHAPAHDISCTDPEKRMANVASVRAAVEMYGSIAPGVVIAVHPEDYLPAREPGDEAARLENCRASLKELGEAARPYGARVAVENMRVRPDAQNRTGRFTDQLSEVVAELDPAVVGICLDTGHANISEKISVAEAFARNAERIIHIHYDDNVGGDDIHLQPGEGNIDFAAFFRAMRDARYDEIVELEVNVPEGDNPRDFAKRNYAYFRSIASTA
jgi:sugar phosphate isomerase/epimerase